MKITLELDDVLSLLGKQLQMELTMDNVEVRTEPFEIEIHNPKAIPQKGGSLPVVSSESLPAEFRPDETPTKEDTVVQESDLPNESSDTEDASEPKIFTLGEMLNPHRPGDPDDGASQTRIYPTNKYKAPPVDLNSIFTEDEQQETDLQEHSDPPGKTTPEEIAAAGRRKASLESGR